ncbi:DUF6023 family protein [Actinoplanes sp. TFC3]|uniref:DUF6023 family protein n=1 Tax=Actinoplanes sp. TFC3 TaxID=1710355 RepID=UPI000836B49F|nr:DUF6023 family protein [Actinoplanes sp. TFC3]
MKLKRSRGAALYASALVLLVVGAVWFFRAAPRTGEDPLVAAGRTAVERIVPDTALQAGAETIVLAAGSTVERNTEVRGGSYVLLMACAGRQQVRVRLSTTTVDSGKAVRCAAQPLTVTLDVALASQLFLAVTSEDGESVVFRWRLMPAG